MKEKLRQSLIYLTKENNSKSSMAVVNEVDRTLNVCYIDTIETNNSSPIGPGSARLIVSSNGFLIYPKVDSIVIISYTDDDEAFVSMFSDIDDIKMKVGNEIWLNGDELDGLVIVGELVKKLNNIEKLINQHLLNYNAHTHPVSGGSTLVTTADGQTLIETQQVDIENMKVKQGKQ